MAAYFENSNDFQYLERVIRAPWEFEEKPNGVAFTFPVSTKLADKPEVGDELADLFYPDVDDVSSLIKIGHRSVRREAPAQHVVEVMIEWPLPNDFVDRLELAAETIVYVCMQQNTRPIYEKLL